VPGSSWPNTCPPAGSVSPAAPSPRADRRHPARLPGGDRHQPWHEPAM
jgi:hypothetical protein